MKKCRTLLAALLFIIPFITNAQVPGTISYQGILMQSDGITPITDGAHSIVFAFYTAASGGSALFTKTISVTTTKGLYTCIIGGGSGVNAPFSASEMNTIGSQQMYIGVALDGGSELSPRAQLTTSPYTLRAQSVTQTANATGGNIAYWGTNNTLGTDNGLFWDNTNKRLGIGTTTPSRPLQVNGQIQASSTIIADGGFSGASLVTGGLITAGLNLLVNGSVSPFASDAAPGSEYAVKLIRPGQAGKNANSAEIKLSTFEAGITGRTSMGFWLTGLPNNENTFGNVPEVPVMTLWGFDDSGNIGRVGIGTQSPDATLSVNGAATKVGGGTFGTFSDIRLKNNVKDFTDGLDVLRRIQPKTFRYNGLGGIAKSTKDEIGIIAQEVAPVAPYMITTVSKNLNDNDKDKTDLLMFDGGNSLLFVLVNSVKEQQVQIDALKKEIEELKKLVESVKALSASTSTGK